MGLELLLPVVFFLITLIIIYLLRVEDRRDRRLDLIKKRMGDFSSEVERVIQNFRDAAQITEERITKRAESSKSLIAKLDEQLSDLQGRSEDLSKLQEVLNTYRDSISRLGATTANVEGRIGQVKREIERLETVNATIQEFDRQMEERMGAFDRSMHEESGRQEAFAKGLERRYAQYQREVEDLSQESDRIIEESQSSLAGFQQRLDATAAEEQVRFEETKSQFAQLMERHREELATLCQQHDEQCEERLQSFSTTCDTELQTMVQTAINRIDDAFKSMVQVIIGFIQDLEDRATQSEELNALLVRQQQANLAEYSEEIQLLQQLSTQSESSVRRDELRRRELMEVRAHLREETVALRGELDQMLAEKQALLTANTRAKREQESLQSALAHLSLTLIERQDELIRSDEGEQYEGSVAFQAGEDEQIESSLTGEEELDHEAMTAESSDGEPGVELDSPEAEDISVDASEAPEDDTQVDEDDADNLPEEGEALGDEMAGESGFPGSVQGEEREESGSQERASSEGEDQGEGAGERAEDDIQVDDDAGNLFEERVAPADERAGESDFPDSDQAREWEELLAQERALSGGEAQREGEDETTEDDTQVNEDDAGNLPEEGEALGDAMAGESDFPGTEQPREVEDYSGDEAPKPLVQEVEDRLEDSEVTALDEPMGEPVDREDAQEHIDGDAPSSEAERAWVEYILEGDEEEISLEEEDDLDP